MPCVEYAKVQIPGKALQQVRRPRFSAQTEAAKNWSNTLGTKRWYGSSQRSAQGWPYRLIWLQLRRIAPVQVLVRDNNVDQALRALKKKMQREGVFREMKLRRTYEKPSERRARERAEAIRRYRKLLRKRMEREGY
jgi:small subunit ribosomal protein S21